MKKNKILRFWRVLLILGLLIAAAPVQAQTDYRVTGVTFSHPVTTGQFFRMTEDLTVSWKAPTGVDPAPMNYYLKFNESSEAWTGLDPNNAATYDFEVAHPVDFKIIPKSFFDAYDSDKLRYLHIRTQYPPGPAYSDDVVSAAIRIDNVAPTGTITLNPTSGNSTSTTVKISPSLDTKNYWISNSASYQPVEGEKQDYTLFPEATGSFFPSYPQTNYGNVTIYAWFRDMAGNMTTGPTASAVYNYQAPVSINHNNVFQISVGGNLGFTVDGTTTYAWTITDRSPTDVAAFSGGGTGPVNAASVTVVGAKAGTFTVTATPTPGDPLKTGTITVVQDYILGDVDGNGVVNVFDVIKIARASLGLENTGVFIAAAADINKDGAINVFDVIRAARLSLGLSI